LLLLQRSDPIFLLLITLRALLLRHLVAPRRRSTLLEAVAAVHGLVAARLERNARLASAVAACRGEHLALAAAVAAATAAVSTTTAATGVPSAAATTTASATLGATRGTVSGATGRCVLESAACVELLLAGGPDEFLPAVLAGQGLVLKAHGIVLQSSRPTHIGSCEPGSLSSVGLRPGSARG